METGQRKEAGGRRSNEDDRWFLKNSGRWGPYRQAGPSPARHRPGARSARRDSAFHGLADLCKEGDPTMSFLSWLGAVRRTTACSSVKRNRGLFRTTGRLHVEALE